MTTTHVIFYYTSGTGNSYQLCLWAREHYQKKGISTQLVPIEKANPKVDIKDKKQTFLFFVMPTHGFTAPWSMLKFCIAFPRMKGVRCAILASKAGYLLGRVLLPGINGSGNYWVSSLLTLKGLLPEAMTSINMPSNWTTLHPAHNEENVKEIFRRAQIRLHKFLRSIEIGRGRFFTSNNVAEFIWGFLLFPITFLYFLYGKIFLAKTYYVNEKCDNCNLCVEVCPTKSLVKKGTGYFWKYTCENCMRCHNVCPQKAIQGSYSWGVLLCFLVSLSALTGWLALLLYYALVVGAYYLLYWLSVQSWSLKLLNMSTPTIWYRRYKIPGLDVKKMNSRE